MTASRLRWAVVPWAVSLLALPLVARLDPPRRSQAADVYTIPAGTAERVAAGAPVADALPGRVTTRVGHTLEVVNADTAAHTFGPFVLAPGQRWVRRFAQPGEVRMACSVFPTADFVIQVDPAAAARGPADAARAIAVAAWAALASALTAGLVAAVAAVVAAGSGGAAATVGAGAGDLALPSRAAAPKGLALARTAAAALPGAAVLCLASAALAMSRVVPWATAVSSGAARAWALDTVLWGVVAAVVGSLGPAAPDAPGDRRVFAAVAAFALAVALVAAGLGLWAEGWMGG